MFALCFQVPLKAIIQPRLLYGCNLGRFKRMYAMFDGRLEEELIHVGAVPLRIGHCL